MPPDEDFTAPGPGEVTVAVIVDSTYSVTSVSVDGSEVDSGSYDEAGNDPLIGVTTVSIHVPAPDGTRLAIELAMDQDGADRGTISATVEVTGSDADTSSAPDSVDGDAGSDGTPATEDSSETSEDDDQ